MTRRFLVLLVFAACAITAEGAPHADPLKSDECRDALAAMEQAFATPGSPGKQARIAAARESAAGACLGHSRRPGTRSGAPEPAQAVPPPVIATPAAPSAFAPLATPLPSPLPALVVPRPTVITTCDPAGCWDSDGRRLNTMGPLLMGPRGVCTVQGGIANCP